MRVVVLFGRVPGKPIRDLVPAVFPLVTFFPSVHFRLVEIPWSTGVVVKSHLGKNGKFTVGRVRYRLCKLRVIPRSRVLRGVYGTMTPFTFYSAAVWAAGGAGRDYACEFGRGII